jgi:hypothetical protein
MPFDFRIPFFGYITAFPPILAPLRPHGQKHVPEQANGRAEQDPVLGGNDGEG